MSILIKNVLDLAELLRQDGDKVLNANSKLALSTKLLFNLNSIFSSFVDEIENLESSFQVCNSSKIDIIRECKFIHDFVQKTIGLKITYECADEDLSVDITKFRHLKYLELKKVSIPLVKGLQGIRDQLESISCAGRKGVSSVKQLLVDCGGDNAAGFLWGSLRQLALPHNGLEKLDKSLELAPFLQTLDLSHNLITSTAYLECLYVLKYVNLGFNKLEAGPTFNKLTYHTLQVLVLKNNFIESIDGLQGLENLNELDLSFNCLTEHSALWPLQSMSALIWVSLEGNPLAYHPKHRQRTIKYFHPTLSNTKFVLDHLPLSKSEKLQIAENRTFPITSKHSISRENLSSSIVSTASNMSLSLDASSFNNIMEHSQSSEMTDSISKLSQKSKKKRNIKQATIITDDDFEKEERKNSSNNLSSSLLETSSDHLETKKQIIALREKFGKSDWLRSHAGAYIQDIMGIQATSSPTPISSILNIEPSDEKFKIVNMLDRNIVEKLDSIDEIETKTETVSLNSANEAEDSEKEDTNNVQKSTSKMSNSINNLHEENSDIYAVQIKKTETEMEGLFLSITPSYIKEIEPIHGVIKNIWSVNSILSCVLGRSEPVTIDIIYDTTREKRQNRRYFLDISDAKQIAATLDEKIKARPIVLKVFKCIKCSTHFSQDEEYTTVSVKSLPGGKQLKCPACDSPLVIQTDELSSVGGENDKTIQDPGLSLLKEKSLEDLEKNDLEHSESHSSIGSATSLEDSRESTPLANASTKKYESDIEILSNPSQSSIEVLDENSKSLTPKRKRSSEERKTFVTPLTPILDSGPITAGLTESSSSGSLTDSICTAYENKEAQGTINKKNMNNVEKETIFTPVTNLTSMLGGLLQSMKIGNNKMSVLKSEEMEDSTFFGSNVRYSYSDFKTIDHRVKLHIILNIFEHESEEIVFLLRADIFTQSLTEIFPGCIVLSTNKCYLLKINGFEGEDPQKWLHTEASWTIDRLKLFTPLPFKQGIIVELEKLNKITGELDSFSIVCILQDFQRTSNFLFYLTDISLPENCEVDCHVPEHCISLVHDMLSSTNNYENEASIRILAFFSSATLKFDNTDTNVNYSGLIVTSTALIILKSNLNWLIVGNSDPPEILKEQAMTNLIAIEFNDESLTLNFLDDVLGLEETWILQFVSKDASEAVIYAVQPPWEKLFSIPLQVTTKTVEA
ncbi:serine/threonine-protein kinase 11-interacting protein isoform X2 [Prorops nasuta]|uniref:serine/threonine-protein kinase 11-interacting protein isoform X2 n=1 Tax=Prorops nasuta TaxID=863751 RepID=UPI0034CFBF22